MAPEYKVEVEDWWKVNPDPESHAITEAAVRVFTEDGVVSVRKGKLFDVRLEAVDEPSAAKQAEHFAEKLLSNPVVEIASLRSITQSE